MDIMLILQLFVLFGAIFLGIRLGGMAIGYAGGLGVLVLCLLLGMKPGDIPFDVILIIMSVIAAITAMQVAGGLDYMVQVAERVLRKNPKYINYLAPTVTYLLTIFAGTGHTAFSMIPVIVEVAKEQNIKPSAPLSVAVVSSQIAITASPVSAAVVYMSGALEEFGWSYPTLILIWIVTTFSGCMVTAFIVSKFFPLDLRKDAVYQERLQKGLIKIHSGEGYKELPKQAKLSVLIFLVGVLCVVFYATSISDVLRKPMLNYVNSFIPADIHKELDKIKTDAINKTSLMQGNIESLQKTISSEILGLHTSFTEDIFTKDSNRSNDYIAALEQAKKNILSDVLIHDNTAETFRIFLESSFANIATQIENSPANQGLITKLAKIVKSYIDPVRLPRDGAIMCFMLAIATFIVILCKVDTSRLLDTSTFKSGMTACVCVLGVAWLGNTFVGGYKHEIGELAGKFVNEYPFLLAVALFLASMLLYSQAATAKAIMPVVIVALGITASNADSSYILVASFCAVSALFVLPTYPTLLGAVQMDDTGSTRIGKYIFNHSFIVPGTLAIVISVAIGFLVAPLFI
ncbi:anaerobic C4-dicarboxylate transporter [Helicobacter muridarum]|uniref:C4-dicarboxylate transporter DcuA n=1 Tax=Helicobacter muridarum TaxID=216 RepID=A0A099TYC7_9HELI|nr:anaerobic C4-dicarboxylate transporter [Helicobacter muridarum]TLE00179.1 anaerobic C4-dicarboxylate transporter [Helicobacter muridarum]STQ87012.1 anaerobic C4-dicarboxylate transporter [Helicobacter muridarum]